MSLNFAVIGAGAFGSLIGGYLAEAGQNVFLVGRKAHIDAINKKKLKINGVRGEKSIDVPGGTEINDIPFKPDVYIITVKMSDNQAIIEQIKNDIDDNTILLSFQNGIPIDDISKYTDKGKVLAAVTGWAATFDSYGKITHTSDGSFIVGGDPARINSEQDPGVIKLVEVLNKVAETKADSNIYGHLWIKLLISSLYSVLAVGGLSFGDVINFTKVKKVLFRVWSEGYNTAKTLGVKIETYLGQLEPEMLVVNGVADFIRASFVVEVMLRDRKAHKPSVLQDLEKGKVTEVPYLNGYIISKAKEVSIETPMSEIVMNMVDEIENKTRKISRANINLLEKALIFGKEKVGLK